MDENLGSRAVSLREVARRMGISRQEASRLERSALGKLRRSGMLLELYRLSLAWRSGHVRDGARGARTIRMDWD